MMPFSVEDTLMLACGGETGNHDMSRREGEGEERVTYLDVDKVMWANCTCHRLLNKF